MLVWLVAQQDGTFIDETNVDNIPAVGERITTDKAYEVLELPPQDDNARKSNAQVLVVKPAG